MKKKWICAMMCITLASTMLAGCRSNGDSQEGTGNTQAETELAEGQTAKEQDDSTESVNQEPCEITYFTWSQSPDGEYPQNMIDAFEEKYPWITVNFEMGPQSPDEYVQSQKVKFLAGDGVDVTTIRPEMLEEYVKAGYLEELTGRDYLNNYSKDSLENVMVDGKVYTIPYMKDVIGVMYNKDMFAENGWEVPTCHSEWLDLCDKVAKAGITPMINGLKDGWPIACELAPFMQRVYVDNPDIFKQIAKGEVKYTDQVFVDCFTKIQTYFNSSAVTKDAVGLTYDQSATHFATGKAAMMCHGEWAMGNIMAAEPEFEIGVFQIPYNDKDEKQIGSISIGQSQAVAAGSKNKEAATLFVEYMSGEDAAQLLADACGNFSAVQGISSPGKEQWNELLDAESLPFYYDQMYVGASNEMYKQIQLMFIGDVTVEEALNNIQTVQEKKE